MLVAAGVGGGRELLGKLGVRRLQIQHHRHTGQFTPASSSWLIRLNRARSSWL